MAVLTPAEQATLRTEMLAGDTPGTKVKADFIAAFQEIEDWFEANRADLGTAITGSWTSPQKKRLVKFWLRYKFGVE